MSRARHVLRAAARRLAWALVVIAGVASVSFLVTEELPGDPARVMLGPQATHEEVERARVRYGFGKTRGGVELGFRSRLRVLTDPARRYAAYWRRLVHAGPPPVNGKRDTAHPSCAAVGPFVHVDLGYSSYYTRPVVDVLAAKIPRSIELALAALAVQLAIGVGLGLVAAARRGTAWDEAAVAASLIGVSAPTFLLGLALRYVLAYKLRWLPFDGYGATSADHLRSLVLPALTLGTFGSALYIRLVRDELGGLLAQDFVRTARAKGASGARVLVVHALRNALGPIATLAALELGAMIGGAIVTEKLFLWPGVGQMAVDAVQNRDAPLVFGTVLFTAAAVVVSMAALDAVLAWLDPRGSNDSSG